MCVTDSLQKNKSGLAAVAMNQIGRLFPMLDEVNRCTYLCKDFICIPIDRQMR